MKACIVKTTTWLLLVSLLIPLCTFLSFAEPDDAEAALTDQAAEEAPVEDEVDALYELTELRTADTKYIKMSDGTVRATVYSSAVHRMDGDGVWQEIDNTLSEKNGAVGNDRVTFCKNAGRGQLLTLTDGGYSVSLSLSGASDNAAVSVENDGKTEPACKTKYEELTTVSKAVSSVRYNGVLPDTDLEYVLSGNNVKENVVIGRAKEEYVYTFTLTVEGLTAKALEDGSIALLDGENQIFSIPAPFMYDAAGDFSDEVFYTLSGGDGSYTLTVTASDKWINLPERVFPVTVDPTITLTDYPETATMQYGGHQCFWINKSHSSYLALQNVPNPLGMPILGAQLDLKIAGCSSSLAGAYIALHRIDYTGTLAALNNGTATYGTEDMLYIDNHLINASTTVSFNLLSNADFLVRSYGSAAIFYMLSLTGTTETDKVWFYSSAETANLKPALTVTYGYIHSESMLSPGENDIASVYYLEDCNPNGPTYRKFLKTVNGSSDPVLSLYTPYEGRATVAFFSGTHGVKIYYNFDEVYLYSSIQGDSIAAKVGSTEDEWAVICMNDSYLIVLADNPMLALTRTSTGAEIAALESNNEDQKWFVCLGTQPQYENHYLDPGIYYINSNYTKTFLIPGNTTSVHMEAGTQSYFGDKMAWEIAYAGNGKYTIRNIDSPFRYLRASASSVQLTSDYGSIPSGALFTILYSGTTYTIKTENGKYLKADSNGVGLSTSVTNTAKWRLVKKGEYHEVKLSNATDFSVLMAPNQYADITANGADSYTYSSFSSDYSFTSEDTNIANFGSTTVSYGHISNYVNVTNVTATHLPTGQQKTFRLWVGDAIWCFRTADVRLSASATNGITVTSKKSSEEENFGMQLWYTKLASVVNGTVYYYIHSLHIKDSGNKDELSLMHGSSGLVLQDKAESGDDVNKQQWSFVKNGNSYNIKNRYSGKYLTASDTSDESIVTMSNTAYPWTLEGVETLDLPECVHQNGYNDSGTIHHIKVNNNNVSQSNTALFNLLSSHSFLTEVFDAWGGITSNIVFHYPEDTNCPDDALVIDIFDSSLTPPEADIANMGLSSYYDDNDNEISANDTWSKVIIRIEANRNVTPAVSNLSDDEYIALIKRTALHEIGHALKLSHKFTEEHIDSITISNETMLTYDVDIRYYTEYDDRYYLSGFFNDPPSNIYFYHKSETEIITTMTYNDGFITILPSFIDKVDLIQKWGV